MEQKEDLVLLKKNIDLWVKQFSRQVTDLEYHIKEVNARTVYYREMHLSIGRFLSRIEEENKKFDNLKKQVKEVREELVRRRFI